jgi:broad specificity phosphatase PhoE
VKLPAAAWLAIGRIAWFLGCARNCESRAEVLERAEQSATRLEGAAADSNSIMLVTHGWFKLYKSWDTLRLAVTHDCGI